MKTQYRLACRLAWVAALALAAHSATAAPRSEAGEALSKPPEGLSYTPKGADTCIRCHDENDTYPVFAIFKTKHARASDLRTPFAGRQCEACHGPGAEHARKSRGGEKGGFIMTFGKRSAVAPGEQNRMCLQCHEDHGRIAWKGSPHQRNDVACADCHRIHAVEDPVRVRAEQPEVCYACHPRQRAEFYRMSAHPIRDGKMACSECHDPHGSFNPALLLRPTINETCYNCHAEKRGPFLWQHAPAAEDCSLCHSPHGSTHPSLLKKIPPYLCQQCHSQAGHPSFPLSGTSSHGPAPARQGLPQLSFSDPRLQ